MEWLNAIKKTFGANNPFKYLLTREQAGEILLKLHTSEGQLANWMINQFAYALNNKIYDPKKSFPLVLDFENNKLMDGAHKLAGFIASDLDVCEFELMFVAHENI